MADEEVAEGGGEEGGGGGGGNKMMIIIIAVVVLIAGGAAAFFLLMGGEEEEGAEEEVVMTGVAEPLETPLFLDLGPPFIVNLKDGRRYLKTKMQLMMSEQMAYDYLTIRLVEVKDIVLAELQELSIEEIKQPASKEALRKRLITGISSLFPSKPEWEDQEPIRKVLFEEFYVQ